MTERQTNPDQNDTSGREIRESAPRRVLSSRTITKVQSSSLEGRDVRGAVEDEVAAHHLGQ
jgi:hypothetical protein